MSERDLIREYKNTISDLSKEKDDAIKLVSQKDSKINNYLFKLNKLHKMYKIWVKKLQS